MSTSSGWISVGDLGAAFRPDAYLLPRTLALAGTLLDLYFEDGHVVRHSFETDTRLVRTVIQGRAPGESASDVRVDSYSATEIRPGVFLVDLVEQRGTATSVSIVLDSARGIFTSVTGQLPSETEARRPLLERAAKGDELTGVTASVLSGAIGAPFTAGTARHVPTRELIGRRVEYTYSATERYEHVYLNENLYTWHCLAGTELGLADTDRCEYRKLDERLYLLVWREKIIPTLGVLLLDFDQLKTTGKMFGYRTFDCGAVTNFPVGAHARLLNVTSHA